MFKEYKKRAQEMQEQAKEQAEALEAVRETIERERQEAREFREAMEKAEEVATATLEKIGQELKTQKEARKFGGELLELLQNIEKKGQTLENGARENPQTLEKIRNKWEELHTTRKQQSRETLQALKQWQKFQEFEELRETMGERYGDPETLRELQEIKREGMEQLKKEGQHEEAEKLGREVEHLADLLQFLDRKKTPKS